MQAEVLCRGEVVGRLDWTADAYGVQVALDCACPPQAPALLRCYGETPQGGVLAVGLPEPIEGRLRLRRHLSRETLRTAGCAAAPPVRFYLAERPEQAPQASAAPPAAGPPALHTGDEVLDSLLADNRVSIRAVEGGVELRCAFAPDRPFALAPAFVLCTVKNGEAVLHWIKEGRSR